jgi:hypothetical protein
LAELPDDAKHFLTLVLGGVPLEMEVGFRSNASYALQAVRGELAQAFQALHDEALKAEAMLRFLHEKVTGREKLTLNPWDWEV